MKPGAFFVNTSQGDIVNEEALIEAIPRLGPVIIDAWSHEPTINTRLMNMVDIATPHIAGYSLQGKQIGSAMAVRAIARFLSIKELYDYFPTTDNMEYQAVKIDVLDKTQGQVAAIMQLPHFHRRLHVQDESYQVRAVAQQLPVQEGILPLMSQATKLKTT